MRIEETILSNLMFNEEYCRKVIPHMNKEYFADSKEVIIASVLINFFNKFNSPPSPEIVNIELSNIKGISDEEFNSCVKYTNTLQEKRDINQNWLLIETEKFCKDRSVYNGIVDSFKIIDGQDKSRTQDAIPSIMTQALSVSFDTRIGHDYFDDAAARFEYYHRKENKIAFDLEIFNKITGGGMSKKTLNIILAATSVGKSMFMCHVATGCLLDGKNVLYITNEMEEERIAQRIDANLMNLTMDELKTIDLDTFNNKINKISEKSRGKLIIKEYPPSSAHSGHYRALIEDLKIKRNFVPDIIMIDYLNICTSAKMKMGGSVNSYTYIKSIAEELRALAVEYDVPILSATQTTRGGFNNTDIDLNDTSESWGLPATADFMFALISTEELEEMGQLMVKQLKNRYGDDNYYKKFIIGVDRSKMRLFNAEPSAQENISESGQPTQKSKFGGRNNDNVVDFKFNE